MFFDPTCKPETKADPFSLESLIAWLEKQPADGRYCITEPRTCLLGQFAQYMGAADPFSMSTKLENRIGYRSIAFGQDSDWTFGAALERARKALADAGG